MITSAIAIILVLGGLIFFHELGHFLVARLLGVGVKAFSLGFGPKVAGFTRGQTQYKLSLIPLGGYVQLAGESGQEEEDFPHDKLFMSKPPALRMLVVAAGPFFNFLLAFLIYWALILNQGLTALVPSVGQVLEGSPAMEAGVRPGDVILAIDGQRLEFFSEIAEKIRDGHGKPVTLLVQRDSDELTMTMTPRLRKVKTLFGDDEEIPMIGIQASGETIAVPMDTGSSFTAALERTWANATFIVRGIGKMIQGAVSTKEIGGPIMIGQVIGEQAHKGMVEVLLLAAFISVNLGLINLLPIPVLDGGHLLYFLVEMVRGKPLDEKWQAIATRAGLFFLFSLMALALYNDLVRILDT